MPEELEKMTIDHHTETYEGIVASSAIGMALLESTGVRALIDRHCEFDRDQRTLSPGMVVKALIGPTFNIRSKDPLYVVNKAYSTAPTDRLFGPSVKPESLYDVALGRGLDCLYASGDLDKLFAKCADACVERFGFESHVRHIDSSNFSCFSLPKPCSGDDAVVPEHAGDPKDMRRDLLQYCIQVSVDSNRIIRQSKAFRGSASDVTMNKDTIQFIADTMDESERARLTIVADCKLLNFPVVDLIEAQNLGFVTRCPDSFGRLARERAVEAALLVGLEPLPDHDGIGYADLDMDAYRNRPGDDHVTLRFVVTLEESKVRDELERIRKEENDRITRTLGGITRSVYMSQGDAEAAIAAASGDLELPEGAVVRAVRLSDTEAEEVVGNQIKRVPPGFDGWWGIRVDCPFDEEAARPAAERAACFVLVTNLPRSDKKEDNCRDGARPQDIVSLYREEYKVEHSFRLMKSGIGIDEVFLQTPSRESAMMFVVSIAVLMSNIADAVFRRADARLDGRTLTMHSLAYEYQTTLVCFSRQDRRLYVKGSDGVADRLFATTDLLRINPQLLLGYQND